jgi:glycosyltransferase involved in cell wall biosynthesis
MCSEAEGLSNALSEYMLRGAVAVATSVGGNPEVVKDGETGLLVEAGDAGALADMCARIRENRASSRVLAALGRTYASRFFSSRQMAESTYQIYSRCEFTVK